MLSHFFSFCLHTFFICLLDSILYRMAINAIVVMTLDIMVMSCMDVKMLYYAKEMSNSDVVYLGAMMCL